MICDVSSCEREQDSDGEKEMKEEKIERDGERQANDVFIVNSLFSHCQLILAEASNNLIYFTKRILIFARVHVPVRLLLVLLMLLPSTFVAFDFVISFFKRQASALIVFRLKIVFTVFSTFECECERMTEGAIHEVMTKNMFHVKVMFYFPCTEWRREEAKLRQRWIYGIE